VIVLAVRWYLRFGRSYRDVEELVTDRGVQVDHVTVYRWVLRFLPLLAEVARPCRHAVGDRWSVDETGTVASGPKVPLAGSKVEPLLVQTAARSAQSNQSWHHR
jgi:transposase-like protein